MPNSKAKKNIFWGEHRKGSNCDFEIELSLP